MNDGMWRLQAGADRCGGATRQPRVGLAPRLTANTGAAITGLAAMAPAALGQYDGAFFNGLGNLDAAATPAGSFATGLSSDGSIVVGTSYVFDGVSTQTRAFLWTEVTGMRDLGLPDHGGLESTGAAAVSDDGAVVAGVNGFTLDGAFEVRNALVFFDANAADPVGVVSSRGLAANDVTPDGSIVVGATRLPGPWPVIDDGFYWSRASGPIELPHLPGGSYSWAEAVSADGSVIVGYGDDPDAITALRWTRGSGGRDIEVSQLAGQPVGVPSQAGGVSADGRFVVGRLDGDAFRWTESSGFESLGRLPGAGFAQGLDVSADGGVVVGTNYFDDNPGVAFVWTEKRGMRAVRDALTQDHGLDLSGWWLAYATVVSDDGEILTGFGVNPAGEIEAWLARLPRDGGGERPTLSVDAACPEGGAVEVRWSSATSGGDAAVLFSASQGQFVIPENRPCEGVTLGLGARQLQVVFRGPSDAAGARTLRFGAMPPVVCGALLQLLDLSTCQTSNAASIE